jgi:hypothetical protein
MEAKYGDMEVIEEEEVKQVRELVADLSLDKDMLQSVIRKELPVRVARRADVRRLREEFRARERHVCELMEVPRATVS